MAHEHERSPLMQLKSDRNEVLGSATEKETILNLAKTCMGTGLLALPYAAREAGILLYVFGLIAIALWNVYASHRLCKCLVLLAQPSTENNDRIPESSGIYPLSGSPKTQRHPSPSSSSRHPPPGTATFGKVAWYALGPNGLILLDVTMVLLLLGILIAYNDAIRSFIQGTPFTTGRDFLDAVIIAMLIAPLSVVRDMGYLTRTSAAGLVVLALAVLVIFGYGIANSSTASGISLSWLPRDGLSGVSNWFGCTVFGFGVVPLTFNFRESMAEPDRLPETTLKALLSVAVVYVLVGLGLLVLFPDVQNDILSELPQSGFLPVLTRLAMAIVVAATAPLIIVPCGELVEGKLNNGSNNYWVTATVRFGICFLTVAISVGVPAFVGVLSLVGCFCVAFVGFCIPPLLYVALARAREPNRHLVGDFLLLVWGLAATCISTSIVFRQVVS